MAYALIALTSIHVYAQQAPEAHFPSSAQEHASLLQTLRDLNNDERCSSLYELFGYKTPTDPAVAGHTEVVQLMLNTPCFDMTIKSFGHDLLHKALQANQYHMIKLLLSDQRVRSAFRHNLKSLVNHAASQGNEPNLVKAILTSDGTPPEYIDEAFRSAVVYGNAAMAKLIFDNALVEPHTLMLAMGWALYYNEAAIADWLKAHISPTQMQEAQSLASSTVPGVYLFPFDPMASQLLRGLPIVAAIGAFFAWAE